jgi:dTDP-4-dehydrorhamnose 3,5-epimerase
MTTRFDITNTPLPGVHVLRRMPLGDNRGYLERLYCSDDLHPVLADSRIVQINHTLTEKRGTVRGMHFQYPPQAETKLVSCLRGEVFDVAVDLRRGSPTFLHWHAVTLSATNHLSLLIPAGCAHGFQTLADDCEMLYFHTAAYCREAEGGLNVADPCLAIEWPLSITDMSPRDAGFAMVGDDFQGIAV